MCNECGIMFKYSENVREKMKKFSTQIFIMESKNVILWATYTQPDENSFILLLFKHSKIFIFRQNFILFCGKFLKITMKEFPVEYQPCKIKLLALHLACQILQNERAY